MALRGLLMDYGGVLTDGPELAAAVRRARAAGIATALVSDAREVPAAVAALFDAVVLGPALGVRKPDPEVFRRAAAPAWRRSRRSSAPTSCARCSCSA